MQESEAELGEIPGPITEEGPTKVPGQNDLTQDFSGNLVDSTYKTRGYSVPGKVGLPFHAELEVPYHVSVQA